jgi:hypothetical protein
VTRPAAVETPSPEGLPVRNRTDYEPPGRTPAVPDPAAVRACLLERHREVLEVVLSCADAVATGWEGDATSDRAAVVEPYRAALREADALEPLRGTLAAAVAATDHDLAATPVAAPPYLVVTGQGVVLRAPLSTGGRLVVTLRAFAVAPYRRGPDLPRALDVEHRER